MADTLIEVNQLLEMMARADDATGARMLEFFPVEAMLTPDEHRWLENVCNQLNEHMKNSDDVERLIESEGNKRYDEGWNNGYDAGEERTAKAITSEEMSRINYLRQEADKVAAQIAELQLQRDEMNRAIAALGDGMARVAERDLDELDRVVA